MFLSYLVSSFVHIVKKDNKSESSSQSCKHGVKILFHFFRVQEIDKFSFHNKYILRVKQKVNNSDGE